MSPKEANKNFITMAQVHLTMLQAENFGKPTKEDLEFAGRLHEFIEGEDNNVDRHSR